MLKLSKPKLIGLVAVLSALLAGSWMALQAVGGQNGVSVKALNYDDRVRFVIENEKASILRAEVFDLAGKRLFDSGPTMGNALDWDMSSESGERIAHGVYLYVITAWDSQGELLKSQVGKLALVPGGVGLGQAPTLASGEEKASPEAKEEQVRALAYSHEGDWTVSGKIGVGTDTPSFTVDIIGDIYVGDGSGTDSFFVGGRDLSQSRVNTFYSHSSELMGLSHQLTTGSGRVEVGQFRFTGVGGNAGYMSFWTKSSSDTSKQERMRITTSGLVGIGTTSPAAALEVNASTSNLLVLKDSSAGGATVFRVEKDGDVYADRAYYCGLSSGCFNAGTGADVAERIDTSEPVEPGDVVEIDPENPGQYRKAQEPYSIRVAGVISTAPAITLGNAFDAAAEQWEDNRPLLALAGRVPVKITTENGPIGVGDFLTTSSTPGYAMRCPDLTKCTGAILGKALEPLEEGTGVIMVQVTLR